VEIEPGYAEACNNLAGAYFQVGKKDSAVAWFERAVRLKPGYAEAFVNLGITYTVLGQPDQAISAYQKALAVRPGLEKALFNLGVLYENSGALEKAEECFVQVLRTNPSHAKARALLDEICNAAAASIDSGISAVQREIDLLANLELSPEAPAVVEETPKGIGPDLEPADEQNDGKECTS
jgi:tetratricopeptide (TPR) repeat protein